MLAVGLAARILQAANAIACNLQKQRRVTKVSNLNDHAATKTMMQKQ